MAIQAAPLIGTAGPSKSVQRSSDRHSQLRSNLKLGQNFSATYAL